MIFDRTNGQQLYNGDGQSLSIREQYILCETMGFDENKTHLKIGVKRKQNNRFGRRTRDNDIYYTWEPVDSDRLLHCQSVAARRWTGRWVKAYTPSNNIDHGKIVVFRDLPSANQQKSEIRPIEYLTHLSDISHDYTIGQLIIFDIPVGRKLFNQDGLSKEIFPPDSILAQIVNIRNGHAKLAIDGEDGKKYHTWEPLDSPNIKTILQCTAPDTTNQNDSLNAEDDFIGIRIISENPSKTIWIHSLLFNDFSDFYQEMYNSDNEKTTDNVWIIYEHPHNEIFSIIDYAEYKQHGIEYLSNSCENDPIKLFYSLAMLKYTTEDKDFNHLIKALYEDSNLFLKFFENYYNILKYSKDFPKINALMNIIIRSIPAENIENLIEDLLMNKKDIALIKKYAINSEDYILYEAIAEQLIVKKEDVDELKSFFLEASDTIRNKFKEKNSYDLFRLAETAIEYGKWTHFMTLIKIQKEYDAKFGEDHGHDSALAYLHQKMAEQLILNGEHTNLMLFFSKIGKYNSSGIKQVGCYDLEKTAIKNNKPNCLRHLLIFHQHIVKAYDDLPSSVNYSALKHQYDAISPECLKVIAGLQHQYGDTIHIITKIKGEYQTGSRSYWDSKGISDDLTKIVKNARGEASWFFSGNNTRAAILAATDDEIDVRDYNSTAQAVQALQQY
ncbi:MAG: hypothetical protein GY821_04225 [Gammaproteobacteria bacterium]|nr:hypothetical protein [Gammaproteobacteria bacterium]